MIPDRQEGPVLAEARGGVLLLTLNRPERANALTPEMERTYRELLDAAARDADVRAVVVTGAGRAFCAGAEFDDLDALVRDPSSNPFAGPSFRAPLALPKPLVAAVHGACAGIGLVQALYADVRFVAADARITTSFVRRGIVAEQGAAALLVRAVGETHARDLLLSGRVVDGEEAARMGLATRSLPRDAVLDAALDYARDLAEHCAPRAVAVVKAQLDALRDPGYHAAADADAPRLAAALAGPDFAEGLASFTGKRAPDFPGHAEGPVR